MKKLVILTSVLALAACSGGGSGGGAVAPINPDDNGFPTINAPENSGDNGAVNAGSETTDNENGGENNTENTDSNDSSAVTGGDNNNASSDNDNGESGAAGATDENNSGVTGDNNENAGTENSGAQDSGSASNDENTNVPNETPAEDNAPQTPDVPNTPEIPDDTKWILTRDLSNITLTTKYDEEYVTISQDENGKITNIDIPDGDYEDYFYNKTFKMDVDNRLKTPKNYEYWLPIGFYSELILGMAGGFMVAWSDTPLTIEQIQQEYRETLNNATNITDADREKIEGLIDSMTEKNKKSAMHYSDFVHFDPETLGSWYEKTEYQIMDGIKFMGEKTGLRYSDFGRMDIKYDINGTETPDSDIFFGGDTTKLVSREEMEQIKNGMNFKGRAIGYVEYFMNDQQIDNPLDRTELALESDDVNLNFKEGAETLTMKFPNWYDVHVVSEKNGEGTVTFSNGDRIAPENARYKFDGADVEYTYDTGQKYPSDSVYDISAGWLDTHYYGENGNPTEVVGTMEFEVQKFPNDEDYQYKELDFEVSFGGTRVE